MIKSIILIVLFWFIVTPVTTKDGDEVYRKAFQDFLDCSAEKLTDEDKNTFKIKLTLRQLCEVKFEEEDAKQEDAKLEDENENPEIPIEDAEVIATPGAEDGETVSSDLDSANAETLGTDAETENKDAETIIADAEAENKDAEIIVPDAEAKNTDAVEDEAIVAEETLASLTREPELEKELAECQEASKAYKEKAEKYDTLVPYTKGLFDYITGLLADYKALEDRTASVAEEKCEEKMIRVNELLGRLDAKLTDANEEIIRLRSSDEPENLEDTPNLSNNQGEPIDDYPYLPDDYNENSQLITPEIPMRGRMRSLGNELKRQMNYLEHRLDPLAEEVSQLNDAYLVTVRELVDDTECSDVSSSIKVTFPMKDVGEMEITNFEMYDADLSKVTYTVDIQIKPTYESSGDIKGMLPLECIFLGRVIVKTNTRDPLNEIVRMIHLTLELNSITSTNEETFTISAASEKIILDEVQRQINEEHYQRTFFAKMSSCLENRQIYEPLKHRVEE